MLQLLSVIFRDHAHLEHDLLNDFYSVKLPTIVEKVIKKPKCGP